MPRFSNPARPPRCESCEAWSRIHDHGGLCAKMSVAVLPAHTVVSTRNGPIDLDPPHPPGHTPPTFGCVLHTDYAVTAFEP